MAARAKKVKGFKVMAEVGENGAASSSCSGASNYMFGKGGLKANGKLGSSCPPAQPPQNQPQPVICCPQCGNNGEKAKIYLDGTRVLADSSTVQRFLCMNCGFRFSDPHRPKRPLQKLPKQSLNSASAYTLKCQACDETQGRRALAAQKGLAILAAVDPQRESPTREGTATSSTGLQGKIVEFLWWMKKQGYAESTIEGRARVIKVLMQRGANLLDPESVKDIIAQQKWSEARKAVAVKAYTCFLKMTGGEWKPPICRDIRKLPFIPLEREIDDLIACCNQHIAAFLRIAKETGARAGEIYSLTWSDVDFERQTIRITAEKNSNPRIFKMSNTLTAMLNRLPKESPCLFHHYASLKHLRRSFQRYRKRAAIKLGNPRILQITFHTLRHWKGTMEYAKTKDILHVMQVLGHKNIKNTLIYTQLIKNIKEDEYICKVAKTPSEIQELIENGFEYVCQKDDLIFFRKRK